MIFGGPPYLKHLPVRFALMASIPRSSRAWSHIRFRLEDRVRVPDPELSATIRRSGPEPLPIESRVHASGRPRAIDRGRARARPRTTTPVHGDASLIALPNRSFAHAVFLRLVDITDTTNKASVPLGRTFASARSTRSTLNRTTLISGKAIQTPFDSSQSMTN